MKLTKDNLNIWDACSSGRKWFLSQKETDGVKLTKTLLDYKINWANWLIVRILNKKQKLQYIIFAAETAIGLYEKAFPNDNRPRQIIEAAKKVVKNPTQENRENAGAIVATHVAYVIYPLATRAAYATIIAANAAAYAIDATDACANAAAYAIDATDACANAAAYAIKRKIVLYGLSLLNRKEKNK